jgi:hypothetical protein
MGEFSPFGPLFYLGRFFENYTSSAKFWATFFPQDKLRVIAFDKKTGLATLYAIFSHSHLGSML